MKKLLKTGTMLFGVLLYSGSDGMDRRLPNNGVCYHSAFEILEKISDFCAKDFVERYMQGVDLAPQYLATHHYVEGPKSFLDAVANRGSVTAFLALVAGRPDSVTVDLVVRCMSALADDQWSSADCENAMSSLVDIIVGREGLDALLARRDSFQRILDGMNHNLGSRAAAKRFFQKKGLL